MVVSQLHFQQKFRIQLLKSLFDASRTWRQAMFTISLQTNSSKTIFHVDLSALSRRGFPVPSSFIWHCWSDLSGVQLCKHLNSWPSVPRAHFHSDNHRYVSRACSLKGGVKQRSGAYDKYTWATTQLSLKVVGLRLYLAHIAALMRFAGTRHLM